MNELEIILTEASIEEIDQAIREIDWLCKYDITDRSSDIVIAALKYVRKLKEMIKIIEHGTIEKKRCEKCGC